VRGEPPVLPQLKVCHPEARAFNGAKDLWMFSPMVKSLKLCDECVWSRFLSAAWRGEVVPIPEAT